MAAHITFESETEKQKLREIRRTERQRILQEAEREHDRKVKKKELARQQGEGTWMLQSVDERIKHEEEALKDVLSSKRKKKHKKKTKKKKTKHNSSESDDGEDGEQLMWQEKSASSLTTHTALSSDKAAKTIGPRLERDSWMTDEANIFSSTAATIQKRNTKAEARQAEAEALEKIRSSRELNPYWKEGGTGLPSEHTDHNPPPPASSSAVRMNDGGFSWWKKAYQRCTELAAEENRPLEEVAAERYGSLAVLKAKLEEAKNAELQSQCSDRKSQLKSYTGRFQRPDESQHGGANASRNLTEYRVTSRDLSAPWRKKDSRFIRPDSSEAYDKDDVRGEDRKHDEPTADVKQRQVSRSSEALCSQNQASRPADSSSSDDSDDDSSDSESSSSNNKSQDAATTDQPARVLTDQELNQLGAKILRAEMMGDESLASRLKAELEAARSAKSVQDSKKSMSTSEESEVVVLSRTDQRGMVRPLPSRKHAVEPKRGRRKKDKVSTHSSSGSRERYFDDDDSYSLKAMVEREKLGTSEDQNRMFARLASRSVGQTDEDFQMDDALLDRAARKQSQSHIESREQQLAIIEHKKMSAALDRCPFCFSNIPKHLIVAIGMKVCLIVPRHQSINEGHCLIVPMQHVVQATVVDEDVWDEIKIFRKGLTRMFSDRGEDCVFMETCMKLKRYPHMVIECIPLPKEVGDMAPIYFKKAIQECEKEWADNKKLVDLSQKDIRKSVPKGFAYFSVDFGAEGGFAHVIEDEKYFPPYFGREVVGGMLDLEPRLWRNPHKEQFEEQRRKVLHVAEMWKPYDWTRRLRGDKE